MSALTTDDLARKGGPIRFILPGMDIGAMDSAGAKSCRGCNSKPRAEQGVFYFPVQPSNIPPQSLLVQG